MSQSASDLVGLKARINTRLKLVLTVERDDGHTVYVHAEAISREIFDAHFMAIARTYTQIQAGLGAISGMRVAWRLLQRAANEYADKETAEQQNGALLAEIIRLANVLAPDGEGGWRVFPLDDALRKSYFNEDDRDEVLNALAFFTVCSVMLRRKVLPIYMAGAAVVWGAQTSSLNCTEYAAFLTKSIAEGSTGAKAMG